jgi:hypothetical protein
LNRYERIHSLRVEQTTDKPCDRVGVIDMIAHDSKTDEAVLVMNEPEPWNDSDERLIELQERFNAYVSFLLEAIRRFASAR